MLYSKELSQTLTELTNESKGISELKEREKEFTAHLSCLILILVQLFGTFVENHLQR